MKIFIKMKKSAFLIISFFCALILLSACSNEKNESVASNTSQITTANEESAVETTVSTAEIIEKTGISKVYFEMYNSKNEFDISEEILEYIEKSKTDKNIEIDNSLLEVSDFYIVYSDSEEKFGKIYSDLSGNLYLSANSNNKYAVEISMTNENTISAKEKIDNYRERIHN